LLPSVGPGDQAEHARQRMVLGQGGAARLVALDLGLVAWFAGVIAGSGALLTIGLIVTVVGFGSTLALLGQAIVVGVRSGRRRTR
ncbi:MAG TPA: hypothetical protein VFI34_09605, partial [Candidatus Limnocylindrales bacterium]|nr:hypothetical protein [Candidatus Limnocylindrales bacterium]